MTFLRVFASLGLVACVIPRATAQTHGHVSVHAADNIYAAGQVTAPGGGNVPTAVIPVVAGEQCLVFRKVKGPIEKRCASTEGCITLNNGQNFNDPDGVGGQQTPTSNTGTNLISGIKAPNEGYLVGVFLPPGGPSGNAPAALDFDKKKGTGFHTLSPELDQTFFVGDGKRGDGTGTKQQFVIPTGAGSIVLGFSDTCAGGNGPPGCYYDNHRRFVVLYKTSLDQCK